MEDFAGNKIDERQRNDRASRTFARLSLSHWVLLDRPAELTERPQEAAMDVLSDVLLSVRLTGAVFFDVDAHAPFATESPRRGDR